MSTTPLLSMCPQDVWNFQILVKWTAHETRNLSLVSKEGLKIVEEAGKAPYPDLSIKGEEVQYEGGDMWTFLHFKVRQVFVKSHPELKANLQEVTKKIIAKNQEPDIEHFVEHIPDRMDSSDGALFISLIPFDFTSKKIPAYGPRSITKALQSAVWQSCLSKVEKSGEKVEESGELESFNPIQDCIRMVLSHPNAAEIKSDGLFGYVDILKEPIIWGTRSPHLTVRTILGCCYAEEKIPIVELEKLSKMAQDKKKPEIEKVLSDHLEKVRKAQPKKV